MIGLVVTEPGTESSKQSGNVHILPDIVKVALMLCRLGKRMIILYITMRWVLSDMSIARKFPPTRPIFLIDN